MNESSKYTSHDVQQENVIIQTLYQNTRATAPFCKDENVELQDHFSMCSLQCPAVVFELQCSDKTTLLTFTKQFFDICESVSDLSRLLFDASKTYNTCKSRADKKINRQLLCQSNNRFRHFSSEKVKRIAGLLSLI